MQDAGTPYNIKCPMIPKVKGSKKINYCLLWLTQKYYLIEYFNDIQLFNEESELINVYRHQSKL